jgi:hypothetical protein
VVEIAMLLKVAPQPCAISQTFWRPSWAQQGRQAERMIKHAWRLDRLTRPRRRAPACLAASFTCVGLYFALAFHAQPTQPCVAPAAPVSQGCINQGSDRRVGATVVCWAQRHLSWKSEHEPPFVLIGNPECTSIGLAWPPYLVYNSPDGSGSWHMFRIGFRYDLNWRGYISPTVAWKRVSRPLRY